MIIKKKIKLHYLLIILLLIIFCLLINNFSSDVVYADKNYKNVAMGILPIVDDDIAIFNQELNYDFSKNEKLCDFSTTYDIRNSGNDKTLQMFLPINTNIKQYKLNKPTIECNNENIEYKPYLIPNKDSSYMTGESYTKELYEYHQSDKVDLNEIIGQYYSINSGVYFKDENTNMVPMNETTVQDVEIEFDINFSNTFLLYDDENVIEIFSRASGYSRITINPKIGFYMYQ